MSFMIRNARLAFPQIWEPKTVNGEGEPSFSALLIIDAKDPQIKLIEAEIEKTALNKWGAKAQEMMRLMKAKGNLALHNGEEKANYDGFGEGTMYVSCRAKASQRPLIVDRNRNMLTINDGRPYAGCYVNAMVDFWAQDNNYGKRVNAQLGGLQFVQDGDAFSGSAPVTPDAFDSLDATDDGSDMI